MNDLLDHNCPVQGLMMIEVNKPCNWCGKLDDPDIIKQRNKRGVENAKTYKESSSRR